MNFYVIKDYLLFKVFMKNLKHKTLFCFYA